MTKAQKAAEKAEWGGLSRGEAAAFFLMVRYSGGERYKSVRRYKTRFAEEGLLTETGKAPEPASAFSTSDTAEDRERMGREHDARFTEKGHALYKKMCAAELAPVQEAVAEIEVTPGIDVIFIDLTNGKIRFKLPSGEERDFTSPYDPDLPKEIGKILVKHPGWHLMYSSSCDFPKENGFDDDYDVRDVMAKAQAHGWRLTGIRVTSSTISDVIEELSIASLLHKKPRWPLPMLFPRGAGEEDALYVFMDGNELGRFTDGMKYADRLAACKSDPSCTSESASATPNGALPAAKLAPTSASKRTAGSRGKPAKSTAGNAKRAGRSARTTKGSSQKSPRGRGG